MCNLFFAVDGHSLSHAPPMTRFFSPEGFGDDLWPDHDISMGTPPIPFFPGIRIFPENQQNFRGNRSVFAKKGG